MNELLPSGVRGLVLAALICALISSLDATMNSVSTLFVRDFALRFRPRASERAQVAIGRWAIAAGTAAGVGAAYLVYKTPEGLYKYLQTISIYLVMPITPAIIFGILNRRVNMKGAVASVGVGIVLAAVFVADQLMGVEAGASFPIPSSRSHTELHLPGSMGNGPDYDHPLRCFLFDVATSAGKARYNNGPLGPEMGAFRRDGRLAIAFGRPQSCHRDLLLVVMVERSRI